MQSMKSIPFLSIVSIFAAMPASGIEAPPDDAPPPVEVAPPVDERPRSGVLEAMPDDAPAPAPAPFGAPAYLGVVSIGVPGLLAEHLGLKAGEGVVIQAVMPDGPAASAGLAVHDVITRLAGDPVGSSGELSARVTARKAGESVRLDVIHKGAPKQVDVTLGSRPAQNAAAPEPRPLDGLKLDGIPKDLAERIRRTIEGNLEDLRFEFERGMEEAAPHIEDAMREMRERMGRAVEEFNIPGVPEDGRFQIHRGASLRLMDEQGSIELKSVDGGKEITIRDKEDKIIWSGPWDTEQDKASAPDEIRRRVERLDIEAGGDGLRLRLRGAPPVPAEPE
jgi:serine protease Do